MSWDTLVNLNHTMIISGGEVLEEFDTISEKEIQEIVRKSKATSC